MPSLVMRAPRGSLLETDQPADRARQIDYGAALGLPWGISESAYNARDMEFTYQYSNFGVPGLGLKRGLERERRHRALRDGAGRHGRSRRPPRANFARLAAIGARGRYGFYEALDFTRSRLPEGQNVAIVRAYMAHHQGMTIVAIANALLDGVDARALSRRADRAGDRAAAAGAHAARRRGRPSAGRRGQRRPPRCSDLEPALVRRLRTPHGAAPARICSPTAATP